jgi:hypothetical protein
MPDRKAEMKIMNENVAVNGPFKLQAHLNQHAQQREKSTHACMGTIEREEATNAKRQSCGLLIAGC